MKQDGQPMLTIGMIFRNEIRCLERCLKSLEPLRKTISSELIIADTGSSDGSRVIAAGYADILFDFPWVNDFSAARNAVMDRASGKWYLSIDADEFLDADISELIDFLKSPGQEEDICALKVRNYDSFEMDGKYSDFTAIRMVRMSTGLRFRGTIHEAWPFEERECCKVHGLFKTIFHHDGYVEIDGERGQEKRKRNMALLRQQLNRNPLELKTLLQYLESGKGEDDYLKILKSAIKEVEKKGMGWDTLGPPILRHAVKTALEQELPEFWEWTALAEKWFSDSFFTRVDVTYMAFTQSLKDGNSDDAIRYGEHSLRAIRAFQSDSRALADSVFSTILMASPYWEQSLRIYLADIYIKHGNAKRGQELLQNMDGTLLDAQQTGNLLCVLGDLHRLSRLDTAPLITGLIRGIKKPVPSETTAQKRERMFCQTAALAFFAETRAEEQRATGFCRPSYMLFLPLLNECDIGRGAAVLALQDPDEIQLTLSKVKDWKKFPVEALVHALELGISFPLPEENLKIEEMECLTERLSGSMEDYGSWMIDMSGKVFESGKQQNSLQTLAWTHHLILTAVRTFDWKTDETGKGVELARLFAKSEREYLPRFYIPELLRPESLNLLPAFHRFGWYCSKAFEALASEDISTYIQELKSGLAVCPEANAVAKYLMEQTPQLKLCQQSVPKELLSLAEQVGKLLSGYPPSHPAVVAIKASEAYRKVAGLIENNSSLGSDI